MGMNIDDEQLIGYLLKFVTGVPVQCDEIRLVDLYGDKKPSELFDTTTTNHHHYVFTQLKKKGIGKFNRGIVGGGGKWKENSTSRAVYDKNGSVIGFKRAFRFDEENHVWYMKEYHLSDNILKDLSGQIPNEDEFVICRITNVGATSSSQCQENQDLYGNIITPATLVFKEKEEECSVRQQVVHQETPSVSFAAKESNVAAAKEEECSVSVVHEETPSVSLLPKESNVAAAKEEECSVSQKTPSVSLLPKESNLAAGQVEECSVSEVHQETDDIAAYHRKLDAYAASVLEKMVSNIPEPKKDEEDGIPLFWKDL